MISATTPSVAVNSLETPSSVTAYVAASVMSANVSIVTFVASVLSTVTVLTATTLLLAVLATLKSAALRSAVFPVTTVSIVLAFVCFTASRTQFLTVTFTVAGASAYLEEAVIVASPALAAVTTPLASTVATASSLDL